MSVEGVAAGMLFLELPDGVKISFRSRGDIPINELAKEFGGNGHKNAAGARIEGRVPGGRPARRPEGRRKVSPTNGRRSMLKLLSSELNAARADVLAILCTEEDVSQRPGSFTRFTRDVPAHLQRKVFEGKDGQTLLLVPHKMKVHHLLLVGAGKSERLSLEKLRRAAGTAVRTANGLKAASLAFALPDRRLLREGSWEVDPCPYPLLIRAMGEAAILANYRFQKYISSANGKPTVRTVTFVADSRARGRSAPLRPGDRRDGRLGHGPRQGSHERSGERDRARSAGRTGAGCGQGLGLPRPRAERTADPLPWHGGPHRGLERESRSPPVRDHGPQPRRRAQGNRGADR